MGSAYTVIKRQNSFSLGFTVSFLSSYCGGDIVHNILSTYAEIKKKVA
jgi:hypothetical protein